MKTEDQRIAIARVCGIENPEKEIHFYMNGAPCVPDYLSDLNAMREAEKTLTDDECERYQEEICDMELACAPSECPASNYMFHIGAEQKAAAFLRAKNLWVEQEAA